MCGAPDHRPTLSAAAQDLALAQNAIGCTLVVSKQFLKIGAITQIKYVLSKLCQLPQYSYGSLDRLVPESVLILWQPILNLFKKCFLNTQYRHPVPCPIGVTLVVV